MISINSIAFQDEYTGLLSGRGTDTGFPSLIGSISDKEWATIIFEVHTESIDIPCTISAKQIVRTDCTPSGIGSWIDDGFEVGMEIQFTGNGYYTGQQQTISALTDSTITVAGTIHNTGSFTNIDVYDVTPIPRMNFYYNNVGIEDTQTFKSLSDTPNTQKLSATWATNPSNVIMTPQGKSLAWWEDYSTVINYIGVGPTNAYSRQYSITIPFIVKPNVLTGQYQNLLNQLNGITNAPSPWTDEDCLGFLYQIDVLYSTKNNTVNQTTEAILVNGNTGWYDEFLNGGQPNYTFSSIAYSVGGNSVEQIDPLNPTLVTINITSVNSTFRTGSPIVLNFSKIPISQGSYQNTKTNFNQDFVYDRSFQTAGSASVNGHQFGSTIQVITNYSIVVNSPTSATITFTTNMGSAAKTAFSNTQDSYYFIWATPQNPSVVSLATTDRNAVICDVNQAITNTDNPNLLTISTDSSNDIYFYNSPDIDINPQTDFQGMQGEFSYFKCDFLVPVSTQIDAINVRFQSVLYNTTISDKFLNIISTLDLDTFLNNVANDFDGYTNNIDIVIALNYPISQSDPRNFRSIQRKPSLDGSGMLGYEILCGFQIGYQYFQSIVNGIPPFQNIGSRLWSGYYSDSVFNGGTLPSNTDVRTDLLVTWNITDPATGLITEFNRRCSITPGDAGMNDNIVTEMNTFDMNGTNMNGWIANDQQTLVQFTFTSSPYGYAFPIPPAGYNFRATIGLWFDDGSQQTLDITDTAFDLLSSSNWLDQPVIDTSETSEVTVSAWLNGTGLNLKSIRIYCNLSYEHQ